MTSILEEFAYGNLMPEAPFFKNASEYTQAMECVSRSEHELLERLGTADQEIFRAYVDMQGEVQQLAAVKNLIYGFKLGLIMTAESFIGMDDLYVNGKHT